jgi:hypothetical protein
MLAACASVGRGSTSLNSKDLNAVRRVTYHGRVANRHSYRLMEKSGTNVLFLFHSPVEIKASS